MAAISNKEVKNGLGVVMELTKAMGSLKTDAQPGNGGGPDAAGQLPNAGEK
jgi:hypothetical protein